MPAANLSLASKKIIVTRLICFFWLVAKAISWKVWLANRIFPVVPPFNFLFVPSAIHLLLFILSLLALLTLLIFPGKRALLVSVITLELLSCLLDQNRWQPWEYQYIFIIFALIINYKNEANTLSAIAFILASVYFFSGISKLNPAFSQYIRNKIVSQEIFRDSNSITYEWLLYHIGYLLGAIEISLGIGLFFQRTKKTAAIFLIIMHLLILAVFGPFGINYEIIVWPWNVAMVLVLCVFFLSGIPVSISLRSMKQGWNKFIILSCGLLPFLNLFGYWDSFLSASLFSFKPPTMYICLHKPESAETLFPHLITYKNKFLCDDNSILINVNEWSHQEMQVPPYPEIRVYKNIRKSILTRYPSMDATFIVYSYIDGKKIRIELK